MGFLKPLSAVALAMMALLPGRAMAAPSEVVVIATMHGLHAKSATYTYAMLYDLVNRLKPDYVGVEIRQEDTAADQAYLTANYPAEMIHLAQEWKDRAFGFDWLGDDVAGAPVPKDWWSARSPIKKLERALDADPPYQDKQMDALSAQEQAILASATAQSLNDGRYDALSDAYYVRMAEQLSGTPYRALPAFYASRDRHLAENIAEMIRKHPGSRIVIVTGADHRGPILRYLREQLGDAIEVMPIPSDPAQ
jgi:hypothetical protein